MKRNVIVVMAAVLMFMVVPAFSADTIDHQKEYQCQVEARKCMGDLSDAQVKIKKMNEQIKKGTKYSEEDMMKLQKSISDLQRAIDSMKPMDAK